VIWTTIGSWGNQITSLLVFVVLTRLLDPEAFGLIGMATVFTAFVGIFAEQGLGQAIVQRKELEAEHLDTAFWTNLAVGAGLTVIGVLLSGVVAYLYREPQLEPVVAALSITFLFTALKSTQQALLQRELDFRTLSIRQLAAAIVGGVIGILAAALGAGVYALVIRTLVTGLTEVFLLWKIGKWRPRLCYSKEHFQELFQFGMNMIGVRITNFFRRYSDNILIGYFLGAEALGYYMVAYRLARLFMDMLSSVIGQVAITTFARLQDDEVKLKQALTKVAKMVSLIAFPIFTGLVLLAPDLILLFSGEQWLPSVPVMRVLSLSGFTITMQIVLSYLMVGLGKPAQLLKINLVNTITIAIAFIISVQFGIFYVGVAYTFVSVLFFGFYLSAASRIIQFYYREYFTQILWPTIACGIMGVSVYLVKQLFITNLTQSIAFTLIVLGLMGIVVYSVSIFLLRPALLREVRELTFTVLPLRFFRFGRADS
jgi:O-antigen/teichoic acid export membrane protein